MSKLLINENPVMIIPSLAVKIGLNEAVILQQIHYWVHGSRHVIGGRKWIFNTYKEWQEQLPFWSESTIKRTIHSLEKQGLLLSGNWNRSKMDKTKWYTIDYQQLEELTEGEQITPSEEPHRADHETTAAETDPNNKQVDLYELLDDSVDESMPKQATPATVPEKIPVAEVIQYLNEKTNAAYKPSSPKTKELIRARAREGFTLEDFKAVIDLKAAEWLEDPVMCKYLRPETLFGSKFEAYRNQKSWKKELNEEDFDLDE
ncbi:conserved phage C-terminal domain-containing protein [Bacillus sp. FJAT-29814]|uniref:conserved phage C-terminal domain-containing protein n=1 Tax=Bacillus sp. FJAT-29814 TaxID=1729688 RepID=UPI00082CC7E8|nr:conserved phage C-terminal domain-containing protein [Bacillus sp. FJAT-29814]